MLGRQVSTRFADGRAHAATQAAAADGAVADDTRCLAPGFAVIRPDAHRDDVNAAGHRVTELTPERRAA